MEIQKLIEKRGALAKEMNELNETYTGDKFTAEIRAKYEAIENAYDAATDEQKRAEKDNARMAEMRAIRTPIVDPPAPAGGENRGKETGAKTTAEEAQRAAFQRYLLRGASALSGDEYRALAADQDIYGGFLVPPMEVVNSLIQKVDDMVFIRKMARVERVVKAASLGQPTLDTDPADPDWTAEILTGSEDSSMKFGGRELNPHPLAKRIKLSAKLMRVAAQSVEAKVMERLSYKFALAQEKAFLTGTGVNQPLGVFTASSHGISTGRDVSTDNTTTAITADNLFNVKYNLKAGYNPGAAWLFHRDAIKMIRKLKDSQNQYLWQAGLQAGQPDRILDSPFYMSEWVPNTFTTGLYVGIYGNFSYYVIAEALDMQVQRLNELYAEANQVGYIGRMELDGMPVLQEAFTRVKLG